MLARQRQSVIVEELKRAGSAKVSELTQVLGVSDMTVRRDLDVLARAGVDADEVSEADTTGLAAAAPEIVAAVKRLLDGVRNGELAPAPAEPVAAARTGWL